MTGAYCSGACQRAHQQRGLPDTVRVVDTPDAPTPPRNLTHREHGKDNRE